MTAIAVTLCACAIVLAIAVLTSHSSSTAPGCVTVSFASTTGAAQIHACGARADRLCRGEIPVPRSIAGDVQRRCRDAGLE